MREEQLKKMTKAQKIHWGFAIDAHKMVEHDILSHLAETMHIPDGWNEIWENPDRRDPVRQRVTIRMDADVVKFFKGLGEGYQHRMNRVLRMFMHYRLAGVVEGPDTSDFALRPETLLTEMKQRPDWGDYWEWYKDQKGRRKPA